MTISYDAGRFDLANSDVSASTYLANLGWTATPAVDSATGTVEVSLAGGTTLPMGVAELIVLTFHVHIAAIGGGSPLHLVVSGGAGSQLNGGAVAILPVDNVLSVFATDTWGGNANGNFSGASNWQSGIAPSTAGDDVVLGIPSTRTPPPSWPVNDYPGGTLFHSFTFNGGCTLTGNTVLLNSTGATTILNQGSNTVSLPIVLGGDATIQVSSGSLTVGGSLDSGGHLLTVDAAGSSTATISGSLSGSGSLAKSGDGTLVLAGHNGNARDISVSGGLLKIAAADAVADGASLTVGSGAAALFNVNPAVVRQAVALSPFAPRKNAAFAERKATIGPATPLAAGAALGVQSPADSQAKDRSPLASALVDRVLSRWRS